MAEADALRDGPGAGAPPPAAPAPVSAPEGVAAPETEKVMSLVDHLSELRMRIFKALLAVGVGSLVGYFFVPSLIATLTAPLGGKPLYFTSPGEAFFIQIKLAIVIGIIVGMPVILYQLWAFISPGLTPSERRTARPWVPIAFVFFGVGVGVAWVILPFAIGFLLGFQTPQLQALITADNYFGFVGTLFLAFGLTMEFPIVLVLLSKVGIISSKRLSSSRRYVVLGIAIFAAIVTPGGDIVSPIVLGVTMYLLFELSIVLVRAGGR